MRRSDISDEAGAKKLAGKLRRKGYRLAARTADGVSPSWQIDPRIWTSGWAGKLKPVDGGRPAQQGDSIEPVAKALANRNIPFAFASGFGADGAPEQFREQPRLQKPFQIEQLERCIARLLP
ncbi:hypothetical protein [Bradyrhizobium sp. USDA 4486]